MPTRKTAAADPHNATELVLYAENDGGLYRSQRQPLEKSLQARFDKGTYDATKAVAAWQYFVDAAAKKYAKEFAGNPETPRFSVADRKTAALEMAMNHHGEMRVQASPRKKATPKAARSNPRGAPRATSQHEVLVGNIGTVYTGRSSAKALATFREYVGQSKTGRGRAGGESVTMFRDGQIVREYHGEND